MNDQFEQKSTSRRKLLRTLAVAVLALLVPAVPIVAAMVITSQRAKAGTVITPGYYPVAASAPPAARKGSGLPSGVGVLVALMRHGTTMRTAPGGRPLAKLGTRTEFGSPEAMWVVAHSARWLGVISPLAGNGHVGWIPRSTATLTRVPWELKVSLAARRVTVLKDGKVLQRYTVAIGRPDAPTPTGRFAVTDRLSTGDPTGPYGCCILALSARAPHAIQGWGGGDRIAIHSTPETSSIGLPVSHGCMRLTLAEGQWLLNHIPLGTPTIISSA